MATKKESILNGLITSLASKISCTFRGQNTDVQSALDTLDDGVGYSLSPTYLGTFDGGKVWRETIKVTAPQCVTNGTMVRKEYSTSHTISDLLLATGSMSNGSIQVTMPYITDAGYQLKVYVTNGKITLANSYTGYNSYVGYVIVTYLDRTT